MSHEIKEYAGSILGVPGRFHNAHAWPNAPLLWSTQKWHSELRDVSGYGTNGRMRVEIMFDDNCRNGHNTFHITADVWTDESRRMRDIAAGGCMHDEIAAVFPELMPLIKWHGVASDGPVHYPDNAVYHAGDRDHNGKRKGEPYAWDDAIQFGEFPITYKVGKTFRAWLESAIKSGAPLAVVEVTADNKPHGYQYQPKYSFGDFTDTWHKCPFDTRQEAEQFAAAISRGVRFLRFPTLFSPGKAREFDHARSCAVWPEATDAELSVDPEELRAVLAARLPALLTEFRATIDSTGLQWEPQA